MTDTDELRNTGAAVRPNRSSDPSTDNLASTPSIRRPDVLALGPFQSIWNAWDVADAEIRELPLKHFQEALRHQIEELQNHLDNNEADAVANEGIDIVSIGLNVLRWLDRAPEDISRIAEARARNRLEGQTSAILEKYRV